VVSQFPEMKEGPPEPNKFPIRRLLLFNVMVIAAIVAIWLWKSHQRKIQ
jgi:hypothetical protein